VVSSPASPVGASYMELGAAVVREVAKMEAAPSASVTYDAQARLIRVTLPPRPAPLSGAQSDGPVGSSGSSATRAASSGDASGPFWLEPVVVRRHDTSARSVDEWTGAPVTPAVPDNIQPTTVAPLGNYAVQITWEDGFNQVASFDLLASLQSYKVAPPAGGQGVGVEATVGGLRVTAELSG